MIYIFGILAVCLMLLGHILKALRWSEFVWVYERPARTNLFYALSCGHIINAIVPFRLGDFVRMWISGRMDMRYLLRQCLLMCTLMFVQSVAFGCCLL